MSTHQSIYRARLDRMTFGELWDLAVLLRKHQDAEIAMGDAYPDALRDAIEDHMFPQRETTS